MHTSQAHKRGNQTYAAFAEPAAGPAEATLDGREFEADIRSHFEIDYRRASTDTGVRAKIRALI
jgi:hypothetical protein